MTYHRALLPLILLSDNCPPQQLSQGRCDSSCVPSLSVSSRQARATPQLVARASLPVSPRAHSSLRAGANFGPFVRCRPFRRRVVGYRLWARGIFSPTDTGWLWLTPGAHFKLLFRAVGLVVFQIKFKFKKSARRFCFR